MVDVARSPRALPALPGALLAAARLPPIGAGLLPARPSRSLEPERAAARDRLIAFDRAVVDAARPLRVALIADEALSARVAATCEATAIRPEDWRAMLTAAAPDVLVIGSAWYGNGGAWQYRVGWYAHPDALLLPDLRALLAWCGEARVPSIFWDTGGARTVPRFGDAAGLCDLILAGDAATVAAYRALPARRGAGVVLETAEASGTSVADRLRSGLLARSEATA
jgi:hypothetical protein